MRKKPRSFSADEMFLPDGTPTPEFTAFLESAVKEADTNAVDHRQPPWKAFPNYARYTMGWRMGPGEDYWDAFHAWFRTLNTSEKEAFISAHPEPDSWQDFYENIGPPR